MKATIVLHKNPSIIESIINRVFFGCKTEYVVPEHEPKPDPLEGMTDEQKIEYLKLENKMLKKKLVDANREIISAYNHLWERDSHFWTRNRRNAMGK